MLKLATQPFWLDLMPGVRAQFAPVTTAAYLFAREAAKRTYQEAAAADPDVLDYLTAKAGDALTQPWKDSQREADVTSGVAFSVELAKRGLRAWEGVVGDEGEPLPLTPENVDAFLDCFPVYEAVDRLYVMPVVLLEAEKNASSPSRNGASAEATTTAGRAASPATPAPTGSTN